LPSVSEKPTAAAAVTTEKAAPANNPRKRSRRLTYGESQSPNKSNSATAENTNPATSAATSRDRSNPAPAPTSKKSKVPANNHSIEDFFGVAVKSRTRSQAATAAENAASKGMTSVQELEKLRRQCQELEQTVRDKDQQLKAVSDNQTIMHTALQAGLRQRKKELDEANQSLEMLATTTSGVIERLVRAESAREAHELRDKLASDGARLGRIVYTRAGMRTVETWEDGHSSKALQKRRADLKAKRQALEKRQEAVLQAVQRFEKEGGPVETFGGLMISDGLSAMEAKESIRMHLKTLAVLEAEFAEEERALNDAKAKHIREWKRAQSEDSSHFRSRPKVSLPLLASFFVVATCLSNAPYFHFSYTTVTFYSRFWEKVDSQKFGVPMTSRIIKRWPLRFTNLIRDGQNPERITIPSMYHESTKSTAMSVIHASFLSTMSLRSTTTHLLLFLNAVRVRISTRS
jgi:hypothetical protein